jgi:hypothetical protein|tara:strand:- start:2 stop:247 length:246 start_codon:yes stop_codon:yes gene_type:complete
MNQEIDEPMHVPHTDEIEWFFKFRGEHMGVMDSTKEGAYGFLYSTYQNVSEAELDDAYRGNSLDDEEERVIEQMIDKKRGK